MENIVLIGMSGAGKSTLGVLLAKSVNKNFLDTDLILQQKHGQLLHEIIYKYGLNKFKTFEEQMLLELDVNQTIIATGGSVIYSELGMKKLKEIGKIVYIRVSFANISERLENIITRGIVMEDGQTLEGLYNEREPLYMKYADIVIEVGNEEIEKTLSNIINGFKNNLAVEPLCMKCSFKDRFKVF